MSIHQEAYTALWEQGEEGFYMKVVDIEHTREGSELFADLINLHMQRRVLQQDANAAPHKGNCAHENEGNDDERDERVGSEASVTQHRLRVPGGDNTMAT